MKLFKNKQRNINPFVVCSVLMLFNFSCDRIIDLEIPRKPSKLVVGGLFNADSTMLIRVGRTEHIPLRDQGRPFNEVNNAHVELHENGSFVEVLKYHTYTYLGDLFTDSTVYTTNSFIASEGNRYTISISAPGFEPVEASTNIPSKIPLTDFEVARLKIPLSDGMEGFPGKISFRDPPDEENFYALEVMAETTNENDEIFTRGLGITPLLEEKIDFRKPKSFLDFEIYFSDASFDGQLHTHEFALIWYPDPEWTLGYTAILKHITKAHFEYGTTARLHETETRENPFSLPVQVQTNVKNGLGIFAGFNVSTKSTKFSP